MNTSRCVFHAHKICFLSTRVNFALVLFYIFLKVPCPFEDNIHKKVSQILRKKNTGSWFYERSRDAIIKDTIHCKETLTIAHENVTASESTIRDADMAKAFTDYTKANVLLQTAQSMLAQANQNSSSALSLLQ